jgi:hypothetical protein
MISSCNFSVRSRTTRSSRPSKDRPYLPSPSPYIRACSDDARCHRRCTADHNSSSRALEPAASRVVLLAAVMVMAPPPPPRLWTWSVRRRHRFAIPIPSSVPSRAKTMPMPMARAWMWMEMVRPKGVEWAVVACCSRSRSALATLQVLVVARRARSRQGLHRPGPALRRSSRARSMARDRAPLVAASAWGAPFPSAFHSCPIRSCP